MSLDITDLVNTVHRFRRIDLIEFVSPTWYSASKIVRSSVKKKKKKLSFLMVKTIRARRT